MSRFFLAGIFFILTTESRAQEDSASKYLLLIKTGVFNKDFIKKEPLSKEAFQATITKAFAIIDEDTSEIAGLSRIEIGIYRNLANNMTVVDTTGWRDYELSDCVIVSGCGQVDEQYAISKFRPQGKKEKKFYEGLVYSFNTEENGKKWLYTFSRPIIDPSGNYAILADTAKENNFGCSFYKWNGYKWIEMLNISTRY